MGLERLVSVLQDQRSNYDTDAFLPLFGSIQALTGARPYTGKLGKADTDLVDTAYRVVADHARTLAFAIADGAIPSNEGRGYVLRRVLRRAVRYGKQILGAPPGFFARLVPHVSGQFGAFYPELREKEALIVEVVADEERAFGEMLDRGIKYFGEVVAEMGGQGEGVVSADKAFYLYDTLGFPVDLTALMAAEQGLTVDLPGFAREMEAQKQRSRDAALKAKAGDGGRPLLLQVDETARLQREGVPPTEDEAKYTWHHAPEGTVLAVFTHEGFVDSVDPAAAAAAAGGKTVGVVLDRTGFYAESGGQVADTGRLALEGGWALEVTDAQVFAGYVLHIGKLVAPPGAEAATAPAVRVGAKAACHVDYARRARVAPNHTMTHLLNFALRAVLGPNVDQRGSLVTEEKLRFDFSHNGGALTPEQLAEVEGLVQGAITRALPVSSKVVPLAEAKAINGLRAVFGEVYPDPVRVIAVGEEVDTLLASPDKAEWAGLSVEFCGGTHLGNTREAGAFVLVEETAVAKGIRRVSGVTGEAAASAAAAGAALEAAVAAAEAGSLQAEALEGRVVELRKELDGALVSASLKPRLRRRIDDLGKRAAAERKQAAQAGIDKAVAQLTAAIEGAKAQPFLVLETGAALDSKAVKRLVEASKKASPGLALLVVSCEADGKAMAFAHVPKERVGELPADKWVGATLQALGGRGGGKPELAQGQAKGVTPEQLPQGLKAAQEFAAAALAASVGA
jgi:alanyl-tRNA synthetase